MNFMLNRTALVVTVFLILGGYLLWTEHSAHISLAIPYLPWLILLACPLLHIFMHSGHGHEKHGKSIDEHDIGQSSESSDTELPKVTRKPQSGGRHE